MPTLPDLRSEDTLEDELPQGCDPVVLRRVEDEDASQIWRIVRDSRVLDLNSPYMYLLQCRQFRDTCLVAEMAGEVVGFVIAFLPPDEPRTIFVWQIGVVPEARGHGVAGRLLERLLQVPACHEVDLLATTVTPDNAPSRALFHSLARRLEVPCEVTPYFDKALFPAGDHETEELFRIGPLPSRNRHQGDLSMQTFERLESEVRSYCRSFPAVFRNGLGDRLVDEDGRCYVDFFAGAGVMSYGHNNPRLKEKLLAYLAGDGIVHSLDMATAAKQEFLERFERIVLEPRKLAYKVQFPGPTGTNAVEAALKLARKVTGRHNVVSFTNAFHGMTLGSLAVTGNGFKRAGAGVPLNHTTAMPFAGYLGEDVDTIDLLDAHLEDTGSGLDHPAAIILETVQAEGGIHTASFEWLRRLEKLARRHGVLLIVDDVQVGCGRTGPFFSFEPAGIRPDLVCLSKAISGYGLPMALVLIKPELDVWEPGEHNGTFRGHNLAFVTASEALSYWEDDGLERDVGRKAQIVSSRLAELAQSFPEADGELRGRGLIQGLAFADTSLAGRLSRAAFERGLVIETAGPQDEVLKFLPPLTIQREILDEGLDIVEASLTAVLEADAEPLRKAA